MNFNIDLDQEILNLYQTNLKKQQVFDQQKNFSILSQFSNGNNQDFFIVNKFMQDFISNKNERKIILQNHQMFLKIVQILVQQDYSFISVEDLIEFFYLIITQKLKTSANLDNLVLQNFFQLLKQNIGKPTFNTFKLLQKIIKLHKILIKRNSQYDLNIKYLKSFITVLKYCNFIFLEEQKTIILIINFLFELYSQNLQEIINEGISFYSGKQNQEFVLNNFDVLLFYLLKPYFQKKIFKNEKFQNKINILYKQQKQLLKNFLLVKPKNLKIILEIVTVLLIISNYPQL